MIYRVVLDDTIDLHTSDINCMLLNPSLDLEMNSAGSFNFTLPPSHPYWDAIKVLKSTIDVYEDGDLIFTGRIASIEKNWNNERIVQCEGALAYFNDSIHRQMKWETPLPIASEDPTVHNFLKDILDNHNVFEGAENANRHIFIGNITVDPEVVTREVNYDTTLDILTRMCIDTNGGYMSIRKDLDDGKLYLDWIKDFTEESGQPAQFGLNLLNFDTSLAAEDICTGVLARGAEVNEQTVMLNNVELVDETTYPDMSVTHYIDKYQDILWHREGVEKFGQVVQVHDFSDAQTAWKDGQGQIVANSLFEMAKKWLEEKNTKIETIEVEVAELAWLGEGMPKYKLGQIVELSDDVHMAGESYETRLLPMYKLSCDLNSGSKKVTLGTPPKKELTQISASNSDSSTLSSSGNSSGSGGSGEGEECRVHDVRVDGTSVVTNKIANISLAGKADVSTVNALATTVAGKADTSTVNALATVVASKQDNLVFNSQDAATAHLTKIKNGNDVYDIPSGTEVEANPTGTATSDLTKLKVGSDIYRIPSGGGSGDHLDGMDDPLLGIGSDGDVYFKRSGAVPGGIELRITNLKLKVTRNRDRSNGMVQYSKLRFFDESDNEYSWPSGVTWSSNVTVYENDPIGNSKILQVNNPGTLTLNLPSGVYIDTSIYTKYGWYTANDQPGRDPISWELYVSENGVDYVLIDERTEQTITTNRKTLAFRDEYNTQPPMDLPNITDIFYKKNGLWIKENFVNEEELEEAIEEAKFNNLTMMSDYYSEDEQVVGRWMNGKPVYQRTFTKIFTDATSNWVLFDDSVSYDKLINVLTNQLNTNGEVIPILQDKDASPRFRSYNNVIDYYTTITGSVTYTITLQYTKTTDAPGTGPTKGNLIYLPALYSEEEREVGVWTDGKPLYQKTINTGTLPNATTKTIAHGISNIETICNIFGYASNGDVTFSLPLSYNYDDINLNTRLNANNTNIYLTNNRDRTNFTKSKVTLQYTKTTDTPGSGTWTPEGQLAHHYSTSEHIVGTWIDGNTVYERTWDFGSNVTFPSNTWTNTNIDASNISKIINVQTSNTGGDCFSFEARCASTYIQLNHWRGNNSGIDIRYLILQYTKTS